MYTTETAPQSIQHLRSEASTNDRIRTLEVLRTEVLVNRLGRMILVVLMTTSAGLFITQPANRMIQGWLLGMALMFFIGQLASKRGVTSLNQWLLASGLSLVVMAATMHSKAANPSIIHEGSYVNPRFFLIGLSFIPLVAFDLNRQRRVLVASIVVNLSLLLCYLPLHRLFGVGPEEIMGTSIKNARFVNLASTSSAAALITGMFLLKRANARYESQVVDLAAKVTKQRDELQASMRYASHLQRAVLKRDTGSPKAPSLQVWERPKDILSGDFSFCKSLETGTLLSVVDCTGHGVPGAFVSLLGHACLTQAVERYPTEPAMAMDHLHRLFKSQVNSEVRDGMDMALGMVSTDRRTIWYASARGIAYHVTATNVTQLHAEKRSVGDDHLVPFTLFNQPCEPGDLIVFTSDGYKDQFGGERNKKFGNRRFVEALQTIQGSSPMEALKVLEQQHSAWKGTLEQTDDLCVMIVRV